MGSFSLNRLVLAGLLGLSCLAAPAAALADAAAAAAGSDVPTLADVCVQRADGQYIVDKEKLAAFWLSRHPFNVAAIPPATLAHASLTKLAQFVLSQSTICDNNKLCADVDKTNLNDVEGLTAILLSGRDPSFSTLFTPTSKPAKVEVFYVGSNLENQVLCKGVPAAQVVAQQPGAQTAPSSATVASILDRFRVRATADQLGVPRSEASAFQGMQAATLSVVQDGVARTDTYKISGVVGLLLYNSSPSTTMLGLKVFPYVAGNRNATVPFSGPSKPASADTLDTGVFLQYDLRLKLPQQQISILLSARPDYLWDYVDKSAIETLNLEATPYINDFLNDYINVPGTTVDVEPVGQVHLDLGRYTEDGTNALALTNHNYTRLGGEAGFTVLSIDPKVPLSITTTYTGLTPLAGAARIGYFSSALTWSLDSNKYIGITASYTNGVREDTAKREQLTNFGLSIKY